MPGDRDVKPTSALSAMINARSIGSLPPKDSTTLEASPYRPADLSPDDADPNRRRHLTVIGSTQPALPPNHGSFKKSSAFNPKKRILVPESSSPMKPEPYHNLNPSNASNTDKEDALTKTGTESQASRRSNGNGDISHFFSRASVPAPQLSQNMRPGVNGHTASSQAEVNFRDDSPRPLKRLMRSGEGGLSEPSSSAGSPSCVDVDGGSEENMPGASASAPSTEMPPSSVSRQLDDLHVASSVDVSRQGSSPGIMDMDVDASASPLVDKRVFRGLVPIEDSDDDIAIIPGPTVTKKSNKITIPSSPITPARPFALSGYKGEINPGGLPQAEMKKKYTHYHSAFPNVTLAQFSEAWERSTDNPVRLRKLLNNLNDRADSSKSTSVKAKIPARGPVHVITSSPVTAPVRKLNKGKRIVIEEEEEEEDAYGDSDASMSEEENEKITEEETLHFFNTCDVSELPGITACTMEQAKIVASLRPFADAEDMKKKLRKKKGVSSALFEQYRDIMRGYIEVDRVLTKCERHGEEFAKIMGIWTGAATSTSNEKSGDEKVSTPTEATNTAPDGSVQLLELSETALSEGIKEDASEDVKRAFKGYIRTQPAAIPPPIQLKPYQLLGVNWLNLLYDRGTSCILADEMGLGKTAQVIAFLAHLKSREAPGPHLVIVPASTLDNWIREFSNFAPSLSVHAYYGSQAERSEMRYSLREMEDLDVIVTTYNLATSSPDDRKFLDKMRFRTATYDEGHQLKNSESKKYKDLMRANIPWRLLLTGTPLQNNLQELVSLLSFILPDFFKEAREELRAIFKVPADAQANLLSQQRVTRAKKMMTPFVLRRKKAQVLRDLPSKYEKVEYCDTTPLQKTIYREVLRRSRRAFSDPDAVVEDDVLPDEEGEKPKRGRKTVAPILSSPIATASTSTKTNTNQKESSANVLMELRKASNHPMLFRRIYNDSKLKLMARDCLKELEFHDRNVDYIIEDMEVMNDFELHMFSKQYKQLNKYALKKDEWMQAGKVETLSRLLPQLKSNGDQILIFSQFTQMLAILELVLQTIGIRYLLLTGSTQVSERQSLVDEFSTDPDITVFLLSTRAGGLGLNLMAANTVIIHDQDFNPQQDKQAEDRAYRLGQKRDVTVIKMVTRNSIEEDILQLAQTKLKLDASVSEEANSLGAEAALLPIGEGNDAQTEKAVKRTLMAKLQKRFDEEGDVDIDPSDEPTKADVQEE